MYDFFWVVGGAIDAVDDMDGENVAKTRVVNRGIDFLKAACEFADEVSCFTLFHCLLRALRRTCFLDLSQTSQVYYAPGECIIEYGESCSLGKTVMPASCIKFHVLVTSRTSILGSSWVVLANWAPRLDKVLVGSWQRICDPGAWR